MVTSSNFSRKSFRKVDLRLAHRDGVLRERFGNDALLDRQRNRLTAITGTTDEGLIERMIRLGFGPENLEALRYAPIAEVAWASGRVTDREQVIAVTPTLTSDLFHEPHATALFRSWLAKKPTPALWSLWADYTTDVLNRRRAADEQQFGEGLYQLATRVALASGGLLNQGDICLGEQRVLTRIAQVYGLNEAEL